MRTFRRDAILPRGALLQRSRIEHAPVPSIGPGCRDHRLCAALCPEQALRGFELDGRRGVALELAACTGCGRCVEACPERAIRLVPRPERTDGFLPLAVHEPATCERCLEPFVAAAEEVVCPACAKDLSLFGAARHGAPHGPARNEGETM